jgi:hypothetical protein
MSSVPRIPTYTNPLTVSAALELGLTLEDLGYSLHARDRVIRFAAAAGTLAGCPDLDREDEAVATEAFVDAMPAVPLDSPLWDDPSVLLDAEMLASGSHPFPIPTVGDDDRTEPSDFDAAMDLEDLPLPVSGGAPEPSAEDLADYAAWAEDLERRRDRERDLRPSALDAVRRALYGPDAFA